MVNTIDLNSDLGEIPAQRDVDIALLSVVTSANIACGGHAGDEASMREMAWAAAERGVAIGAHPSYPDREGFGRAEMAIGERELEETLREQIQSLESVVREAGSELSHVKPHGALYHAAMHKRSVAEAIARAVVAVDAKLVLVGLAGAPGMTWWREMGLRATAEGFADRVYAPDGALTPRSVKGSLITDAGKAADQAVRMARGLGVIASDGSVISHHAQTICVHSDTPGALDVAIAVRRGLESAGVRVCAGISRE